MSKKQHSVILLTTSPAGTGKTYCRCAVYLHDEWLKNNHGVHYSNFPINKKALIEAAAKKYKKGVEELEKRVQVIPDDVMKLWLRGESGPWDYFSDADLTGAHIAIDEIHNYCSRRHKAEVRQKWQEWLGEIRHRGATVEFISQSPKKIAFEIDAEAGERIQLVSSESRRDPWFKIPLGDWYELRAGLLTGLYEQSVWEIHERDVAGRWRVTATKKIVITPEYFPFYDSYSTPQKGGKKGKAQEREFQKRSKKSLIWWFFSRYPWPIMSRVAVIIFLAYLMTGGGGQLMQGWLAVFQNGFAGKAKAAEIESDRGETVKAGKSEDLNPKIKALREEIEELKESKAEEKEKRKEIEKKLNDASSVVLVTPDSVILKSGFRYGVGEKITEGTNEGLQLMAIDYKKRAVLLSDQTVLRLGSVPGGLDGEKEEEDTEITE